MIGIFFLAVLAFLWIADVRHGELGVTLDTTALMKGACAVMILMHHITSRTDGGFLNKMNYPSVAVFFLAAGFTTMYGYMKKNRYIWRILVEKIPLLFRYCVFSVFITCLFLVLIGEPASLNEIVLCFAGNRVLNWFFTSLMIKYFLFIGCALTFSTNYKKLTVSVMICICAYIVICRVIGTSGSWYCSSLAFPLGVFIALRIESKQDNIVSKFEMGRMKKTLCWSSILSMLFLITFMGTFSVGTSLSVRVIRLAFQILSASIFAVLALVVCSGKKSIYFLKYCGRNSAQIILLQGIGLACFRNKLIYISSDVVYAMLSLLAMIILVLVTVPVYDVIKDGCELRNQHS